MASNLKINSKQKKVNNLLLPFQIAICLRNKHSESFLYVILSQLKYAVILESSKIDSWTPNAKKALMYEEIMFTSCSAVLLQR